MCACVCVKGASLIQEQLLNLILFLSGVIMKSEGRIGKYGIGGSFRLLIEIADNILVRIDTRLTEYRYDRNV